MTDALAHKSQNLTVPDAASLVFRGIPARVELNQATITGGSTVLVDGGSRAVGITVVQLAAASARM